jgi:hypothetical protein
MAKFCQIPDLFRKVESAPISAPADQSTFRQLCLINHQPFGVILWTIGKLRELPTVIVFGASGVSANPKPKSWVPFSRCSVQNRIQQRIEVDLWNPVTPKLFNGPSCPSFWCFVAGRVAQVYGVQLLGELPKFLMFATGSVAQVFGVQLWDRIVSEPSCFRFFLTAVRFYTDCSFYSSEVILLGLVMFSWLWFQLNMDDYPHFFLAEDGRLCSMG